MTDNKFVFIDIETTGLDPDKHSIVEFGIAVTDPTLDIVAFGPIYPVHTSTKALAESEDAAYALHLKSGLLDHIPTAPGLSWIETQVLKWLTGCNLQPNTHPMCGSSVHFDRSFLKKHMPRLEKWFFYRNIDVSTIKELIQVWQPDVLTGAPTPTKAHRVESDIHDSINELRFYKKTLGL